MSARTYECSGEGILTLSGVDHCCYLSGVQCPHLVEGVAGRRYACSLKLKYGTWAAMNESDEYRPIGEHWQSMGEAYNLCELFDPAFCCRPEHRHGRANQHQPVPKGVSCCGDMG